MEGTANCIPTMKLSIISIAICYLLLNIMLFSAAAVPVEPSRKLAKWSAIGGGGVKLRVIHVYADSSPYRPPNTTWETLIWQTFNTDATSGVPVALLRSTSLSFTPLLTNPAGRPSYYYVSLKGISVGDELLSDIPPETFGLNASDGGGGTIVDSGTVITRLVPPAYNALRDAFRQRISLTPQSDSTHLFDTCYDVSSSGRSTLDAPPITLHFEGGVDLELTQEKTVFSDGSLACLAFSVPPDNSNSMSIIGNYQQQNMRIVYDLPNSRLGFAPDNCSA